MKKKIAFLLALCCLLTGAANAANETQLTLSEFPTNCAHQTTSKGSYVNWAGVSSVSQFADEKGNFCFAVDEGQQVSVYKTESGNVTSKITIANPFDSFGAAACGADGSLYMVWGRNNDTDDKTLSTIFVSKYTPDGVLTASVGGNGSEGAPYYYDDGSYTQTPFDGGNCDVAINGNLLMVNYARKMYNGHQSNTLFAVDTETMTVKTGMAEYNSHSFDQRVTPYSKTGGFLLESQGDCYPRSFATTLTNAGSTLKSMETFHFWVERDAFTNYNMQKLNATRAKLGNILETNSGAALVASSARSLSEAATSEPYDVFVQVFDPSANANSPDAYVTSGVRHGLGGNNGDTQVTDYGVYWLTDLAASGKTARTVQAVSMDDDKIAALYELYEGSRYDSTWCVLLNGDGSIFREASSLGAVRLNVDEDPVFAQGAVQWVANASGADTLTLYSLALRDGQSAPSAPSGLFGNARELTWTLQENAVTVTGPVSAQTPVIAVCYASGGAMLDANILTQSGQTAPMQPNADKMRLFWMDSVWAPKCVPAEIPASLAAA